jgi:hypothetical protein
MTARHPLTRYVGLVATGLALGLGSLHGSAVHRSADESEAAAEARSHFEPRQDEAEQWYFWTDDGVRHYAYEFGTAAGPGDTVIVLHGGWGAEHAYLIDALVPLADRHRLVLYDPRGSLRSPAPDSTVRLERLVADLTRAIQQALNDVVSSTWLPSEANGRHSPSGPVFGPRRC